MMMMMMMMYKADEIDIRQMSVVRSTQHVRHLIVMIDMELTMSEQDAATCRLGLLPASSSSLGCCRLTWHKTVSGAGTLRRLDYCNSLLFGITVSLPRRLQSVQNAAVRAVS